MLRLKDKPIEWVKFTGVMGITLNLVLLMLWWQGLLPIAVPFIGICLAEIAVITAFIKPVWFRGFYRGGMSVSFHIGQIFGKALLTVFFFVMVTPMGLLLRLLGKDLLKIRINPADKTHWHPAKTTREFDRMF